MTKRFLALFFTFINMWGASTIIGSFFKIWDTTLVKTVFLIFQEYFGIN